jgi:hypothetical protein
MLVDRKREKDNVATNTKGKALKGSAQAMAALMVDEITSAWNMSS